MAGGQPTPICAECGQVVWPSEAGPQLFLWYEGDDPDAEQLDETLARAAITHADCADAFRARRDLPA